MKKQIALAFLSLLVLRNDALFSYARVGFISYTLSSSLNDQTSLGWFNSKQSRQEERSHQFVSSLGDYNPTEPSPRTKKRRRKRDRPPLRTNVKSHSLNKKNPAKCNGKATRSWLLQELQQNCRTPHSVIENVAQRYVDIPSSELALVDSDGTLAGIIWTRLCKLLIGYSNSLKDQSTSSSLSEKSAVPAIEDLRILSRLTALGLEMAQKDVDSTRRANDSSELKLGLDAAVEITKSSCVVCRLYPAYVMSMGAASKSTTSNDEDEVVSLYLKHVYIPILKFWESLSAKHLGSTPVTQTITLRPDQLSGLKWAFDTFHFAASATNEKVHIPVYLRLAYEDLGLPFRIVPGGCLPRGTTEPNQPEVLEALSVDRFINEVDFQVDRIVTQSNRVVEERRQTAWQGDDGVHPFQYSEKSMPRKDWTPMVRAIRNHLKEAETIGQYFDCCLLNLYPNGESGMRYHIDPDQGFLWDYDTAVVSIGATRQFSFREILSEPSIELKSGLQGTNKTVGDATKPHTFYVLHGDVTHMFGDCQTRFQHAVKKSLERNEKAARVSLVYKRTWSAQ